MLKSRSEDALVKLVKLVKLRALVKFVKLTSSIKVIKKSKSLDKFEKKVKNIDKFVRIRLSSCWKKQNFMSNQRASKLVEAYGCQKMNITFHITPGKDI